MLSREAMSKEWLLTPAKEDPEEKLKRLNGLGLGRGLDATDPYPWKNKSSFQVRKVTSKDLVVTDAGDPFSYYQHDISSTIDLSAEIKLSIDVPSSSVDIGVDAELSRSVNATKKVVGEKTITETVSFRSDFSDLPLYSIDDEARAMCDHREPCKFEKDLCKWILDRVRARQDQKAESDAAAEAKKTESADVKPAESDTAADLKPAESDTDADVKQKQKARSSTAGSDTTTEESVGAKISELDKELTTDISKLVAYMRSIPRQSDEMRAIVTDCVDFIKELGVTHYVYGFELGAAQFSVVSSEEYTRKVGGRGGISVSQAVKLAATPSYFKHSSSVIKWENEIGHMDPKTKKVKRGTEDEAVLRIMIKPIHTLIQLNYIKLALKGAVREYMIEKENTKVGPFLISFGYEPSGGKKELFLKVNAENELVGTNNLAQASSFFIFYTDDGHYSEEFMIGYCGEEEDKYNNPRGVEDFPSGSMLLAPLAKFLSAPISVFGTDSGPLLLKPNVYKKHSRFILNSRVVVKYKKTPVNIEKWLRGDQFFINCAHRRFKNDGYVAMRRTRDGRYSSSCVSSVKFADREQTWMLFRLLPMGYNGRKMKKKKKVETETDLALPTNLYGYNDLYGPSSKNYVM